MNINIHAERLPATSMNDKNLKQAAIKLEAMFLAETLKSSGFGQPDGSFNGGSGEQHFSSFLVEAQANEIAFAGGIGLAESIFKAISESNKKN